MGFRGFFFNYIFSFFFKILFIYFLERGKEMEGERDGEKYGNVRDTSISCLSCAP